MLNFFIDSEFINLINIRKFPIFPNPRVLLEQQMAQLWQYYFSLGHLLLAKICCPQDDSLE